MVDTSGDSSNDLLTGTPLLETKLYVPTSRKRSPRPRPKRFSHL